MFENNHQKEEPNGYDSDPELYNNSKMYDKNASDLKKSQKQFKKSKLNAQSFIEKDAYDKMNLEQGQAYGNIKITVPKPFSFEEREK